MNKQVIQMAIALFITILFLTICTLAASPESYGLKESSSPLSIKMQNDLDLLVFLSPQYANDMDILASVNNYANTVKSDIGWKTKILTLTQDQNDYKKIDEIIETYYTEFEIKACIIVGEDTDTALGGENNYMKKPSTIPWETIGYESSYEISENGIVCKPYEINICISLLYPTSDKDFNTKKAQIINAFNKFSNKRNIKLNKEILVFESSDLNTNSKDIYKEIDNLADLFYTQDPTDTEIKQSITSSYSMYFVHGHSNPSGTDISAGKNGWFSADYVDQIDTPFFGADGCYVGGWWSNEPNTKTLTPSISSIWYGEKIFTSNNILVMALGLLSQNGLSTQVSFIENSVPDLLNGKTLAESIIGDTHLGDTIIFGDPTFHFDI